MSKLIVHAGGWEAKRADLASVPVPAETDTYMPIPHNRLLEELEVHIPRFGFKLTNERFALAREGNQMFGVLNIENGNNAKDWGLAVGFRNSYDHSFAVDVVMGHNVFICDNMAFSGEIGMNRKHTRNLFRDLPDQIYSMLHKALGLKKGIEEDIDRMKHRDLNTIDVDHYLIESLRKGVLPASSLPKVLAEWDEPKHEEFHPRNAWSLFNAFTEVMKTRSPQLQMENTLKLSNLFRN